MLVTGRKVVSYDIEKNYCLLNEKLVFQIYRYLFKKTFVQMLR